MVVQRRVVKGKVVKKWSRFSLEAAEESEKDTYFSFRGGGTKTCRGGSHHIRKPK